MPFRFEGLEIWHEARAFSGHSVVSGSFLALDRQYISGEQHAKIYEAGGVLGRKINAFRNTLR